MGLSRRLSTVWGMPAVFRWNCRIVAARGRHSYAHQGTPCIEHNDCPEGMCVEQACDFRPLCTTSPECAEAYPELAPWCIHGRCMAVCFTDLDCEPSEYCYNGRCLEYPLSSMNSVYCEFVTGYRESQKGSEIFVGFFLSPRGYVPAGILM